MYIGRFLIVAPNVAAYRVSSRSFPNRQITRRDSALAVLPTQDAEPTENPYISYHCAITTSTHATIGNGSHVDPIAEKLDLGYPPRDALVTALHAMDFEKDDYNTPRIGAVLTTDEAFVGIVRHDALLVTTVNQPTLIATYELDSPTPVDHAWESADAAARGIYDLDYDHPVCAAAVARGGETFEAGIYNG